MKKAEVSDSTLMKAGAVSDRADASTARSSRCDVTGH